MTARLTLAAFIVLIASPGFASATSADRFATQEQEKAQVCIALILPSVSGVEGRATDYSAGLRELFASFLKGPSMQVTMLEARLPALAIQEAQQKGCDNVLSVTMTRKRKGGGNRVLGRVVGRAGSTMAWSIPGGDVAGVAARGAVIAATQTVDELASTTRAKDELTLDYTVTRTDGTRVLPTRQEKGKAKEDGEDLLTPLVEKAATAIVSALASR